MAVDLPLDELRAVAECDASPDTRARYGGDATGLFFLPDAVAFPRSTEEVAAILRLANRDRFPVVPRGAGTGKSGGAVPVAGGLALALERMTRLDIHAADLTATAEPGVVLLDLHRAAEAAGLFYPPDPASLERCTIGGNIAENAGGPRGLKYGVTRDYVLGLTAVTGDGRVLRTGARTIKSVAGYSLTQLLVGSEGTLAVATEAHLKLLPRPPVTRTLVLTFPDMAQAVGVLTAVLRGGVLPCAMELVDAPADRCVRAYLAEQGEPLPDLPALQPGRVHLIVELDGGAQDTREAAAAVVRLARDDQVEHAALARDAAEQQAIWHYRRRVSQGLSRAAPAKLSEDVVVPRSRLADAIGRFRAAAAAAGVELAVYGHAGDGNLHVNLLARNEAERGRGEQAMDAIMRATLDLGGSISGEHGIGLTKARYLAWEVGAEAMDTMRRLKALFDPNHVLNPYKIFPKK